MKLIGFIGAGNMGYAMLRGALSVYDASLLTYTDLLKERMDYVKEETGIDYMDGCEELVRRSRYIVIAVKPQYLSSVVPQIKANITKDKILISILPGISIDELKKQMGEEARIVRAMPNTPAMVLEGMTAISFSADDYTKEEKRTVCEIFGSFGKYEILDEQLMNASVCVNGSSPAYVFLFIEALADGAVKYGIPRDKAYTMAAQTVLGSAKMVLETKEHPGVLKDRVCSPGGTTIAAISALEENGFRSAVIQACDRCYEKTASMKPN